MLEKIREGADGFENAAQLLPPQHNDREVMPELSGKLMLLDCLLANLKANYNDKIVLVSNYTQTLDLFERLCRKRFESKIFFLYFSIKDLKSIKNYFYFIFIYYR